MKTMTCAQMGGMCNAELKGETAEEMISAGMAHLEVAHPEMAQTIKGLAKDDPMLTSWDKKFRADFELAPESE